MEKNWTTEDIPSQEGKVFLITGANSGLGLEVTKQLSAQGAYVIMAVRTMSKGEKALKEVKEQVPQAHLELLKLDLIDLENVRTFAQNFKKHHDKLDVLINNAGIMMPPERMETQQGFEVQLGVNHLAHFLLTAELIEILNSTPHARVISVSSIAAKVKNAAVHWEDIQLKTSYGREKSYCQSKLCNIMFSVELNKRLRSSHASTISVGVHPGLTSTNLQQHMGVFMGSLLRFFGQDVSIGALPILRGATDLSVQGGDYYGPTKFVELRGYPKLIPLPKKAQNLADTHKLWKISEELTQVKFAL